MARFITILHGPGLPATDRLTEGANKPTAPSPTSVVFTPSDSDLHVVKPWKFFWKLTVFVGLLTVGIIGALRHSYPVKAPFQILIGMMFVHAVELAHQCIHQTAFGRKRYGAGLDHRVGRLLCLPMGVSFFSYLVRHLWHHGHNGTELDQESFNYRYGRTWRFHHLLRHCSMIDNYLATLKSMTLAVSGCLPEKLKGDLPNWKLRFAKDIQADYRIMAVLLASGVIASIAFQTTALVDCWLVPLLFIAGPLHALIELPEHYDCSKPTDDVFRNTRTIKAGFFMQWLTNFNNYHVGHHEDMLIPPENLSRYEDALQQNNKYEYLEESYTSFYARVFRDMLTNPAKSTGN